MNRQHQAINLKALLLSLSIGALGVIGLLFLLGVQSVVSASMKVTSHSLTDPSVAPLTTTIEVTKTIEPLNPHTGQAISICFSISGLASNRLDIVLAQDVSGSMNDPAGEGVTQTRLEASKTAASSFVNFLPELDRTAVVSYSTFSRLAHPLTTTKGAITRTLDDLVATGWTNIGAGISMSHRELITSPRYLTDSAKVIILLSDGQANLPLDPETARKYAKERAEAAADDNIKIYTIGFGSDADEDLLQNIAEITDGKYFFAPEGNDLEKVYLTIALELHSLVITDILTPGVDIDCSEWPAGMCLQGPGGVTTVTIPITNSLLISDPTRICFSAVANLDPNYVGSINLPGSGICYKDADGETVCEEFDNPIVTVSGRKIAGYVFYDKNANGLWDAQEAGPSGVVVKTSKGVTTTTNISGQYILRIPSEPAISVTLELPSGHIATTPVFKKIPAVTGIYTWDFGLRAVIHLPFIIENYPPHIIINGGFEDQWSGWIHGGKLSQAISRDFPHSGNHSALLGDPSYPCEGGVPIGSAWVEQTVLIPDTTFPRLVFWYRIFTQDRGVDFDSFDVKIDNVRVFSDAKRDGLYGCAPEVKTDLGWQTAEIDLSGYRGQQVTLRFENRSNPDHWFNTWTFVDDVRIIP